MTVIFCFHPVIRCHSQTDPSVQLIIGGPANSAYAGCRPRIIIGIELGMRAQFVLCLHCALEALCFVALFVFGTFGPVFASETLVFSSFVNEIPPL